jgi:hypothetical protein
MARESRTNKEHSEGRASGSYPDWLGGYRNDLSEDLGTFRRAEASMWPNVGRIRTYRLLDQGGCQEA